MKRISAIILLALATPQGIASELPYIFIDNTPAKAEEVNANFEHLNSLILGNLSASDDLGGRIEELEGVLQPRDFHVYVRRPEGGVLGAIVENACFRARLIRQKSCCRRRIRVRFTGDFSTRHCRSGANRYWRSCNGAGVYL